MSEKKKELPVSKQVAATMIGGTLVAVTMLAIGPVGTLLVGVATNALLFWQVRKDSDKGKT